MVGIMERINRNCTLIFAMRSSWTICRKTAMSNARTRIEVLIGVGFLNVPLTLE